MADLHPLPFADLALRSAYGAVLPDYDTVVFDLGNVLVRWDRRLLYEQLIDDPDRLVFRVAGGAQGDGVVGITVAPTHGIVGYVFSTGEPIALTDVGSDPRFDKRTAEKTGYLPRSIAAVPLVDAGATVQVLEASPSADDLLLAAVSPDGAVNLQPGSVAPGQDDSVIALVSILTTGTRPRTTPPLLWYASMAESVPCPSASGAKR